MKNNFVKTKQKHALVIGGTGMLKDVSLYLAENNYATSVIARTASSLNKLKIINNNIYPIIADYSKPLSLLKGVQKSIKIRGELDIIVAWIHNDSVFLINEILEYFQEIESKICLIFHVIGSKANAQNIRSQILLSESYIQIQLGNKKEKQEIRWLNHREIAEGVIKSIQLNKDVFVGKV